MKTKIKIKTIVVVLSAAMVITLIPLEAQAAVPVISIPVSTGGSGHSLAVMNDGTLWGWGYNDQYQLGNGTCDDFTTPVKIMDHTVSVAAGSMHSLAVKSGGSLFGWGSNTHGQLGVSQDRAKILYGRLRQRILQRYSCQDYGRRGFGSGKRCEFLRH